MNNFIIAYTDGACKGNGKAGASAGGFGVHIIYPNGDVLDVWGGESDTTNNRMELMGAIIALERTPAHTPIQIWTDSGYVQKGISEWIHGWKKKGWKKTDGKPVLNQDLWIRLDNASQNRQIDWQWIKGHAGHQGNEKADQLANRGVLEAGESLTPTTQTPPNPTLTNEPIMTTSPTSDYIDENELNFNLNSPDNYDLDADDLAYYYHHTTILDDNSNQPDNTSVAKNETTTNTMTPQLIRHDHQNPAYDGRTDEIREPFWAILPDPINHDKPERQLIMDTETTGFDPATGDRIVEIGVIEMIKRKPTGIQLHVYLNPDREMDDEVMNVHGIRNEFLTDKPRFADVAPYVYDFMKGAEIIAHNATFDMKFLVSEFDKVGLTNFADAVQVVDTLAIARKTYKGQKNTLDALAKRLDVGQDIDRSYHGALKDSQILLEVYLAMTSGQVIMDIEEENEISHDDNNSVVEFRDLSDFAGELICSSSDLSADKTWRESVLKK